MIKDLSSKKDEKLNLEEQQKKLKINSNRLKNAKIVLNARLKLGTNNEKEVLTFLEAKYGEKKAANLIREFWNFFD